jgi:hypothetical protein
MFQTKVVEKIKTHILSSITFFYFFFYEIMWKNIVELDRQQMTNTACRIPKTTNTHSQYVIFIAFPLQQWLHERTPVLRYTHTVSRVTFLYVHICVLLSNINRLLSI